jgi:membrane-associated protein
VQQYGQWIYAILFVIIFSETGFVVTPFLPGDSLLFVAGALAALGGMEIGIPARGADRRSGAWQHAQLPDRPLPRAEGLPVGAVALFQQGALKRRTPSTKSTAARRWSFRVSCRFSVPLRPFVAGIGAMNYARFTFFNLIGACTWVGSLTLAGYWFGNLPWIQQNLTLVIVAIIAISLLPVGIAGCSNEGLAA